MSDAPDITDRERIARIEASQDALRAEILVLGADVKTIRETVSGGRETNWQNWIGAALLVLAIYAAAIHPMQQDAERIQTDAKALAAAVLVQNEHAAARDRAIAVIEYRLDHEKP